MKIAYLIGCILSLVALGCKHESRSAPPQSPARTLSDGSNTWFVGAVIINGTNVPLSNLQVRAITNQPSK